MMNLSVVVAARRAIRSGEARRMREGLALSQADLAEHLGVTAGAVAHWETGRRVPLAETAVRYVDTLKSLTAANGEDRHVYGPTLDELDRDGDEFAGRMVDEIRHVFAALVEEAGDSLDEASLSTLNRLWPEAVDRLIGDVGRYYGQAADKVHDQLEHEQRAVVTAAVDPVANPVAEQYLESARNRLAGVADILWEVAREQLTEGFSLGEAITQLAARLSDTAVELASPRAEVVARTEVVGASNRGAVQQMNEYGVQYTKEWIATNDTRTRDSHRAVDGSTIPNSERFNVGGAQMDGPHDPSGPPEETVNCRCTLGFDIPEPEIVEDYLEQVTAAAEDDAASEGETMPWHVEQGYSGCGESTPWAVIKDDDGTLEGCHATEAEANDQMAALYAAEDDDLGGKPNQGTKRDKRLRKNRRQSNESEQDVNRKSKLAELANRIHGGQSMQASENDGNKPWKGVLVVEGVRTGDGREFSEGALSWAELPIPLRWQKEGAHGGDHDVTVNVGNITHIWREDNKIMGAGFIDTGHEDGAEIFRRLENDRPGGISIDADDITEADVEFVWPESPEEEDDDGDILMMLFGAPEAVIFHGGRLRGATMCDIPAFVEAEIGLSTWDEINALDIDEPDSDDEEALTAAAAFAPPPAAWFKNPNLSVPTGVTVSEPNPDGWRRVYGHAGQWSECHIGHSNVCVTMPHEDGHDWFLVGAMETDDGETIPVGQLTINTGHAPLPMSKMEASKHYETTGAAIADVTVGNDSHGLWVAGAIRPDADPALVHKLRASGKLSGDWRRVGGKLRLIGLLTVNAGGFPVPRARVAAAGGITDETGHVEALVAAGVLRIGANAFTEEDVDQLATKRAMSMLAARVNGGEGE